MSDSDDDGPPPPPPPDSDEEEEHVAAARYSDDDEPPPPPEDDDDDVPSSEQQEKQPFQDPQVLARMSKLEELRKLQRYQQEQLEVLKLMQARQIEEHQKKVTQRKSQIQEISSKKTTISVPEKDAKQAIFELVSTDEQASQDGNVSQNSSKSYLPGLGAANPSTMLFLANTFSTLRKDVDTLRGMIKQIKPSKAIDLNSNKPIQALMKEVLRVRHRLICLLLTQAIADKDLHRQATTLNDSIHKVIQEYSEMQRSCTTVLPADQPTKPSPVVPAIALPAQVQPQQASSPSSSMPVDSPQPVISPATPAQASPAMSSPMTTSPVVKSRYLVVETSRSRVPNPGTYTDPYITMGLVSESGRLLEPASDLKQEFSVSGEWINMKTFICFSHCIDDLKGDSCVFLELKYTKSVKEKPVVCGWSFFYVDEAREGSFELPLYQKPTDFTRKKFKSFPQLPNGDQCVIQLKITFSDKPISSTK